MNAMSNKVWCSLLASILFISILACGIDEGDDISPPDSDVTCEDGACDPGPELCGTRGTALCAAGEVCIYDQGANCGRTDLPGTCQVAPEICTRIYAPVCGCDGQTYGNACEANAAGVSVDYEGTCLPSDAHCTRDCTDAEYCPLGEGCAPADQTVECVRRPEACTMQYDPVCGCDGRTYGNACSAANQGVSVAYAGECNVTY